MVRALPVGLVLLAAAASAAVRRAGGAGRRVLGLLNIGMFFPLIFLAAYHLPGGLAATLQASAPMVDDGAGLAGLGERPGWARVGAALVGAVGVALLVLRSPGDVDAVGLAAAFGSVLVSAPSASCWSSAGPRRSTT